MLKRGARYKPNRTNEDDAIKGWGDKALLLLLYLFESDIFWGTGLVFLCVTMSIKTYCC